MDRFELQRKEFDAADAFAKALKRHNCTAIVDDDYPEVRHVYESALANLLAAMHGNGRFGRGNRFGLIPTSSSPASGAFHDAAVKELVEAAIEFRAGIAALVICQEQDAPQDIYDAVAEKFQKAADRQDAAIADIGGTA